jgi:REP element-mobilizing transposase RayT
MARPSRIEYRGAIHQVMYGGNLRRSVFQDERDYQRLLQGLEQSGGRFGWDLLSFMLMPNRFHLFLRTPQLDLSRGMQYLISGYANWPPSGIGAIGPRHPGPLQSRSGRG